MSNQPEIRWVVATKPEALRIIEKYRMKSANHEGPYPIFKNSRGHHWLTISGIGRVHAAAATIYLHQNSSAPLWAGWINVGIAGFRAGGYGDLYLVDKIIEKSTDRHMYPRPLISSPVARAALITVDQIETHYGSDELFDMEGSAFFDIACRLSCQQLVMVLKIVSDGLNIDIKKLTKKKMYELVNDNIICISKIISEMESISEQERHRLRVPDAYYLIVDKWHCSQSLKHHLKHLVQRWQVVFPEKNLISYLENASDAKSALQILLSKLNSHTLDWN